MRGQAGTTRGETAFSRRVGRNEACSGTTLGCCAECDGGTRSAAGEFIAPDA